MERKDEFDDENVKQGVIDYFIAKLNKEEIDKIICLPSFTVDDVAFTKTEMSIFDGYSLKWNNDSDGYNRLAFIEVKERSKEWGDPLIEFKKIDKWLEHYDKWKKFYYLNLLPSGLWCLPVHNLKLWKWKDCLEDVEIDGVSVFSFDRTTPRKGGEILKSDRNKMSLTVDKKHWIKLEDYRRNSSE
jgi:hypothetical protein